MRVGFDFDNTLINYYGVFYEIALSKGLIPPTINKDKNSVKEYLKKNNKEDAFTEIQGLVYGREIYKSKPTKHLLTGLSELLKFAKNENLFIVSHKTKYPYIGERINLREAAEKWIEEFLKINKRKIFPKNNIFFEATIEEKVARINSLKCDYYFDDLPLIIEKLPSRIKGILYDPFNKYENYNLEKISNWTYIYDCFK